MAVSDRGRRLLVFDGTCVSGAGGLSPIWSLGSRLYRRLGRIDEARGVSSWGEALDFLSSQIAPIAEVQYWGHGKWGRAFVGSDVLDERVLSRAHPLHTALAQVKQRLAKDALIWFRTCETFGAAPGIAFAEHLAEHLGARVAGHTFIIGFHQSGLHALAPGAHAHWSPEEGLAEGSPHAPTRAKWSTPFSPRTITCLAGEVPNGW
jgi:hypothetical protein